VDSVELARYLIGKVAVQDVDSGGLSGRIVETEVYPIGDAAGHAFREMTIGLVCCRPALAGGVGLLREISWRGEKVFTNCGKRQCRAGHDAAAQRRRPGWPFRPRSDTEIDL
jgi:hypothetical protein